jgi:hypothetical protein
VRRLAQVAAAAATLLVSGALRAQTTTGPCVVTPSSASGVDACTKARDLFAFVIPQVGVALSSGNPILGEGGTMGGWGKRALSVRISAADGRLPRNSVPIGISGGAASSDFGATRTVVPVPSADAAIGVFAGVPLGLTNVGGVDALLGATYLPSVDKNDLSLEPGSSNFAFSYGLRVGALQESSFIPGLSVSFMRRKLPTVNLGYTPSNDSLTVQDMSVTSNTIRLVASKRILIVGIAAGVGRDKIEGSASMRAAVNETVLGTNQRTTVTLSNLRSKVTRNTAFVNASFGLLVARIVGEFGWSSAGTIEQTVNQFGGRQANEGYRYGSVGVTVRF